MSDAYAHTFGKSLESKTSFNRLKFHLFLFFSLLLGRSKRILKEVLSHYLPAVLHLLTKAQFHVEFFLPIPVIDYLPIYRFNPVYVYFYYVYCALVVF